MEKWKNGINKINKIFFILFIQMKQIVNLYKNFQRTCRYHKVVSQRHLKSVNMTYNEHLKHSSGFSLMFIKSSYKALVH
jgi:hypothetical protein